MIVGESWGTSDLKMGWYRGRREAVWQCREGGMLDLFEAEEVSVSPLRQADPGDEWENGLLLVTPGLSRWCISITSEELCHHEWDAVCCISPTIP